MDEQPSDQKVDPTVPTPAFRRDSWKLLQLTLDPLALPRQLPTPQP